ncbi:MAG: FmdB family zinc ribbon protein [Planctomycetota bacterium]
MPLYEFVCHPCDLVFEVLFRSSTEKKKITCPQCGTDDVSKKFSLFGTRTAGKPGSFKGSSGGGGCSSCSASSCKSCS